MIGYAKRDSSKGDPLEFGRTVNLSSLANALRRCYRFIDENREEEELRDSLLRRIKSERDGQEERVRVVYRETGGAVSRKLFWLCVVVLYTSWGFVSIDGNF